VTAYPWIQRERVRFRDVDAMGHVNNAVYSTYLEQSVPITDDLRRTLTT